MKRIVIGVMAVVGVFAAAACGGGGGGQSDECKAYVACYYKTGGTAGSLDSSYGASGSCWTTPTGGESCTSACKTANASYKSSGLAADAGCAF